MLHQIPDMSTRYQAAVEEGEVVLLEDEWAKGE